MKNRWRSAGKKGIAAIVAIIALGFGATDARAVPISEITVPFVSMNYQPGSHFSISGTPSGNSFTVLRTDGTTESINSSFNNFTLNTSGMSFSLSPDFKKISYSAAGALPGALSLVDILSSTSYLLGQLQSLSLEIKDPTLGKIEGEGYFSVLGGSLAGDFGANGGLVSIGISFTTPATFQNGFGGFANTKLFPANEWESVPDTGDTLILLGAAFFGLALVRRRLSSVETPVAV